MSQSRLMQNLSHQQIRIAINNYEHACQTIVAFKSIIEYDLHGNCYQGKKLMTSANNEIQQNVEVNPDLVIEVSKNNMSDEYIAINEIKVDLPREESHWEKDAKQLKKYDDNLSGWNITSSKQHDIMITTNELRTFAFKNYMEKLERENKITINRDFSILHSTRTEQLGSFINIKKDYGQISNQKLDDLLSNGLGVAEYNIVNEMNQMKFYDAAPPIIYTMMIIWDHIIKTFLEPRQLRELKGNKIVSKIVTVEEVRNKLLKFTPESNPNCIKSSWVKTALLGFVEIGLASSVNNDDKFEIRFRKHSGKTLDWLFGKIKKPESKKQSTTLDKFISKDNKGVKQNNTKEKT